MKKNMDFTAIIAFIVSGFIIAAQKNKSTAHDPGSSNTFTNQVINTVQKGFGQLNTVQINALKNIAYSFENYPGAKTIAQFAYIFATAWHESAQLKILREIRAKQGTQLRALQDRYWNTGFYGRGFVQITWEENYLRLQQITGAPIHDDPQLAEHPTVAAEVLVKGMMKGAFTGVGLPSYVNTYKTDFINARRVVNGTDRAVLIAGYADTFFNNFQTVV